jgi:threonine/homoserine/homoserine lactone efflux protein
MNFWQNILLGFTLSAPIGPVNLEAIKNGLKHGFWPAFFIGLGAISADFFYMCSVYFGLGTFLMNALIQKVILALGAGILIYLGLVSLKETAPRKTIQTVALSKKQYYFKGLIIAISSPMTIVWWVGVFGAVLSTSLQKNQTMPFLNSLGISLGCLIWVISLAATAQLAQHLFNDTRYYRMISIIAGLGLIGFGLSFLRQLIII